MMTLKPVYFTISIFLVFFCGRCSSAPFKNVQFITNSEQKSNEAWENELIEPEILEGKLDRTRPGFSDENDQDVENKKLITEEREEIKDKYVKEGVGRKRIMRQVNSAYSPIYPTLSPQNPMYPTPYRPATGVHGNVPNNYYAKNSNSYSKTGYTQPNYYPQGQNPLQQNTSYTNQRYNQTSPYNNQNPTIPYSQFNQYSNQRYNSSVGQPNQYFNNHPSVNNSNPSFQSNFQQNGYNANRNVFTPTPANQWTSSYTNNNTRYNPTAPKYPNFNNSPNTFNNYFNNSTPRTAINGQTSYNPQYNTSNPPYQSYPLSRNSQHNNYNGSNQWSSSSSQTPYNPGSLNYPSIPSDGRSSNVSPQNYPANNNPYNLQPNSPNSQNYPTGPNGHNNPYTRYDPRNNPSQNFSYSH